MDVSFPDLENIDHNPIKLSKPKYVCCLNFTNNVPRVLIIILGNL